MKKNIALYLKFSFIIFLAKLKKNMKNYLLLLAALLTLTMCQKNAPLVSIFLKLFV